MSAQSSPKNAVPKRKASKPTRQWAPTVRFTEEERTIIDQLKGNESYSNYLRKAVLNQKTSAHISTPPPTVNSQTYATLRHLSNNLNQLTRAMNTLIKHGKTSPIDLSVLDEIKIALNQLRLELTPTLGKAIHLEDELGDLE